MNVPVEEPLCVDLPPTLSPEPTQAHSRYQWVRRTLVIAPILVASFLVLLWTTRLDTGIEYETTRIERGSIEASVTATGTLNPVVNVQVGSRVSGNIKALYADFNTKVKKGQLVALIDPELFEAQVRQSEAALSSVHFVAVTAAAQLEKISSDLFGAIAHQKNLEAILVKDRANALNAANQWERADLLFSQGTSDGTGLYLRALSAQDHDTARANYQAAEAQLRADEAQIDAAKHAVQSAQAQVRVAETQLSSARAQERQAQATLDQSKINLEYTRIVAPVDGTVIARNMSVGQTVAASFQVAPLFDIAQDLTKMQVDTNVDESDVGYVRPGQSASFTVDAYPGTKFHGQVTDVRKAPITQQNVVTYDVVIGVPNPELKLFPGMTANVTIFTSRIKDTLKVPNAILRSRPPMAVLSQLGLTAPQPGQQQIYVVRLGALVAVPVTFGVSDGKFTALTSGKVHAGDLVVLRFITNDSAPGKSRFPASPARGSRL